jgi:hypothetical protein
MVRIEDVGTAPPPGQGVPQLVRVGLAMKRFAGTPKLVGAAGWSTTTEGIAFDSTSVLRQAVSETVQTVVELPAQASVFGASETDKKLMALRKTIRKSL